MRNLSASVLAGLPHAVIDELRFFPNSIFDDLLDALARVKDPGLKAHKPETAHAQDEQEILDNYDDQIEDSYDMV